MNVPSSSPPPVEAVPPISAKLAWRVLFAGLAACAVAAVMGVAIDTAALANQPEEMAERLRWASGHAGPNSQPGSVGELRHLHYEIGKTTGQTYGLSTLRIGLVGLGVLAAACGLWMRGAGDWRAWLVAAATAGLGGFGLPMHWDSLRLVLWVAGTASAVAGGLAYLPTQWRSSLLIPAILFHFGGILTATTWPETNGRTAWLSNQTGLRIYQPYFKFMYLSNAYHFYSPDPGPASKFFLLIEYEVDDPDAPGGKRAKAEWVDLPKRRANYRDPLGLTYYRRLSLTELASYSVPGSTLPPSWEKAGIMTRRQQNELDRSGNQESVPGATSVFGEMDMSQYRQPMTPTRRSVLPSYARHIAFEYSRPRLEVVTDDSGKTVERVVPHTVTGVKMFRVEHRIIEAHQFLEYDDPVEALAHQRGAARGSKPTKQGKLSPYHPAMYYPYYLGHFDRDGNLVEPNDPLLYWLTPVQMLPNTTTKDDLNFKDWMSKYAGAEFPWEGKE